MFLTRVLDSQRAGRFFKRSQNTHITKPHLQTTWNDFTNYRFGDPGCRKCANPIFNYKCIIPQNPTCYSTQSIPQTLRLGNWDVGITLMLLHFSHNTDGFFLRYFHMKPHHFEQNYKCLLKQKRFNNTFIFL